MKIPAAVFEGLPSRVSAVDDYDVDGVYRLLDLVTPLPGPNLARLVDALDAVTGKGDDWADVFAFAALRLNNRLHATSPEEAAHWLERARAISEACATEGAAMNWGLATFRSVRRSGEKAPSRLLDVSKQMLAQASRWGARSLITNTLDIALGAVWSLVDVGRTEEATALAHEALALHFTPDDLVQRWLVMRLHRELGVIERKRGNLDAAMEWYEKTRELWRPRIKGAPGELAWLLAEVVHTARLQQQPESVLRHAEDFERELGTSKDPVVKEEAEFVRVERALALLRVGRLSEVEAALDQLPARPVMPSTRSLALRVRVLLAQARGEPEVARQLARKGIKTFAGREELCHDDLEVFREVLRT
jgi:tetratricopeptide (TPR) repeat protein